MYTNLKQRLNKERTSNFKEFQIGTRYQYFETLNSYLPTINPYTDNY